MDYERYSRNNHAIGIAGAVSALLLIGYIVIDITRVPEATEAVEVKTPLFFGFEGVSKEPKKTGRIWHVFTTKYVLYDVRPVQYSEEFHDLVSKDNTPVTFNAYVTVRPERGRTPLLHESFGPEWYGNKMREVFRTRIRDFARGQTLFDLTTNPAITTQGEHDIQKYLVEYLRGEGIPVIVDRVVIGKASPPKEVIDETARTAAQEQRIKTEQARTRAEDARKAAEQAKAVADKAYASQFGMTAEQFLAYRSLEIQREMVDVVKDKQNVNVVVSAGAGAGAQPIFSIK